MARKESTRQWVPVPGEVAVKFATIKRAKCQADFYLKRQELKPSALEATPPELAQELARTGGI